MVFLKASSFFLTLTYTYVKKEAERNLINSALSPSPMGNVRELQHQEENVLKSRGVASTSLKQTIFSFKIKTSRVFPRSSVLFHVSSSGTRSELGSSIPYMSIPHIRDSGTKIPARPPPTPRCKVETLMRGSSCETQ